MKTFRFLVVFVFGAVVAAGADLQVFDRIASTLDAKGVGKAIREESLLALKEIFPEAGFGATRVVSKFEITPGLFYYTFSYSFWRVKAEVSIRREEEWNAHFDRVIQVVRQAHPSIAPFSEARSFMFSKFAKEQERDETPGLSYSVWSAKTKPELLLAHLDLRFVDKGEGLVVVMGTVIYRRSEAVRQKL